MRGMVVGEGGRSSGVLLYNDDHNMVPKAGYICITELSGIGIVRLGIAIIGIGIELP